LTLLLIADASTATAQIGSYANLTVSVTDAQSHQPVALAQVSLVGPAPLVGLTGKDGTVSFAAVPSGTYSGYVFKRGYRTTQLLRVRVDPASAIELSAHIGHDDDFIGSVTTNVHPLFAPNHRQDDSPEAAAGETLRSTLGMMPSVLLGDDAASSSSAQIDGHASNQSGILVDGAPIVPPGVSGNLRAVPSGLFDAVDVSSGSSAFGQGGTISFHVPDPTLAFSSSGHASSAGDQQYAQSVFARGTVGYVGFSAGHATQGDSAAIDGDLYADVTGQTYRHEASARSTGTVLKLRAALSDRNVLSGVVLSSAFRSDQYCLFVVGATPCGYGPGSGESQDLSSVQIKDGMLVGSASLSATVYGDYVSGSNVEPDRTFMGTVMPFGGKYSSKVTGLTFDANLASESRSTISLEASEYSTESTGSANLGEIIGISPTTTERYAKLVANYGRRLTPRFTATFRSGINDTTTSRTTPFGVVDGTLLVGRRDRVDFDLSSGLVGPPTNVSQGLSDVQDLNFDCQRGAALGTAPSSSYEASESTGARVTYTHHSPRVEFVATAYQQVLRGALVSGWISGGALPPSVFPAGYAQSAAAYYASPGICSTALPLSNFALLTQKAMTADYRGIDASAKVTLGAFQLEPFYSLTIATPDSSVPGSSIQAGTQIWSVPAHRYGTVLDWKPHLSRLETALTWRHISSNNTQGLPGYDLLDAGADITGRGDLIISVRNILDRQAPALSTTSDGVPFVVPGIGSVSAAPTPLRPRSFAIAYRVHVGAPEQPTNEGESESILPTSTSFVAPQLPDSPPPNPFEIDRNNSNCGPEQAVLASEILSALKADVARGVSDRGTITLPNGESARIRRDPDGRLALLIKGTRAGVAVALYSCAIVYAPMPADVQSRRGYLPLDSDPRYDLVYAPSIGLYVTLDSRTTKKSNLDLSEYVGRRPAQPFAVVQRPACTADVRTAAAYILDELRDRFENNSTKALDGVTVLARDARTPWFTLTFDDPTVRDAVADCGEVSLLSSARASALGIGLDSYPTIDYANPTGLYVQEQSTR
jgi:hypothetical protein